MRWGTIRTWADAVYFGGESFSLRAGAGNFSLEEMKEGIEFAHSRGVKCHMTLNFFAHNEDVEPFMDYLKEIRGLGIDAFIAADPGVIDMIQPSWRRAAISLAWRAC